MHDLFIRSIFRLIKFIRLTSFTTETFIIDIYFLYLVILGIILIYLLNHLILLFLFIFLSHFLSHLFQMYHLPTKSAYFKFITTWFFFLSDAFQ